MIKFIKLKLLIISFTTLASCSNLLQTIDLAVNEEDTQEQEVFNVVEKTLTLSVARTQRLAPYKRYIIQNGRGFAAKSVPENSVLKSEFPSSNSEQIYKIGIGDTISYSRLIDNKIINSTQKTKWPVEKNGEAYKLGMGDELSLLQIVEETVQGASSLNNDETNNLNYLPTETTQKVIESKGRVGSDGSVLLLEVGRLEAVGKTLNQLRSDVRNIFIRNGASPRFQLEIDKFQSQLAYLTINRNSRIIPLNDQKTSLREILSASDIGPKPGLVTLVSFQRNGETFRAKLRQIFDNVTPDIIVKDRDHIFVEDMVSNTETTDALVGHDGNIVLAGVGKIKANGKTLEQLRNEINFLIEKLPNSQNAFQIEISKFNSQSALISIAGKSGNIIPITNKNLYLDELLIENGLSVESNAIIRIELKRKDKNYLFTLDALLDSNNKRVIIQPEDRISVNTLRYKDNKVFILGGVSPTIIKIDPTQRQTLADILFTPGGALSSLTAKRSQVYLLRGKNPVTAYHLDAQNPTRLIVADAMELRPNDILYVAEQPIASFNRALATIAPLRILLRDIQDENIP